MLRLLRTRAAQFRPGLLQRIQTRHRPEPAQLQLQRVKVRRKWFKPWAFVGGAVIYFACYQFYTASVFGILGKWLEQEVSRMSPKERKKLEQELEESDAAFYIPLPGTTHAVESQPYKGTDPEWKEFAKLSRDRKKINEIKGSLAQYCQKVIERHPYFKDVGKEWKITRTWLDVTYPRLPPPTFERRAICWDEDSLSIVSQPVDSNIVFKLERTLTPTAVTLSMWSFSVALAQQNFHNIAKHFGFEPKAEQVASVQQTLDRLRQRMEKSPSPKAPGSVSESTSLDAKSTDAKDEKALSTEKRQTADGSTTESAAAQSSSADTSHESTTGSRFPGAIGPFSRSPESPDKRSSAKDMHGVREVAEHTAGAWQALKQRWRQVWKPKRPFPPRGSVQFSGLVEVACPKASVVIDVLAWYDPKTDSLDGNTLRLGLRAFRPRQMSPAPSR
ncbi:hypothetical protein SCAR479_13826 [Seiridium cardinale]|uniref:Uncharacterized protein n=1 Tax=Seiridium cardinale TaxID=138064 RepID=A0ABR2X6W3_9PEZI